MLKQSDRTLIDAINASKVLISGSILKEPNVPNCEKYVWKVVTQSTDSSNILIYSPSDVSAFCDGDASAGSKTLLLVLPAHAEWANVVGFAANTQDPTWRPLSSPPPGHNCDGSPPDRDLLPAQGIVPCDFHVKRSLSWPLYRSGWLYNRLTQPGTFQGTISFTPVVAGFGKQNLAFDVQAYGSAKLGSGWIGMPVVFEETSTSQTNLNSLTAAVTYDWRLKNTADFWLPAVNMTTTSAKAPFVGLRPPEMNVRVGPEFAPPQFLKPTQPSAIDAGSALDLNVVGGATARLPIVFSFAKQPSILSVFPLIGIEGGEHVREHLLGEPSELLRKVAGVDASFRWPFQVTHNFLGDKPITLDYSYRTRWLSYPEPYIDLGSTGPEALSTRRRSYTRISLIEPLSAYLQIKVTAQRGSLPPDFRAAGYIFTFGLNFANPGSAEH